MVVQKPDGSTETLTPHEFEQKYGFKNDSAQVHDRQMKRIRARSVSEGMPSADKLDNRPRLRYGL